jgi:GH18 family chitinase
MRNLITNQNFYLNILGPGSQTDSDDWTEQMHDLANRHTSAFESGNLENSIKTVLSTYGFDGIVFDYEFPLRSKDWKAYDNFIISLDNVLGDDYKIGMSLAVWNTNQSKAAMNATDFFEVMSYDLWDDDGYHATYDIAVDDIEKLVKKGYDKAKLDLGVPFYARPTTKEAFWANYKDFSDRLSDDGLVYDEDSGYNLSFNTYDMIREKTEYALNNGIGGMMVWHYACDVPADDENSLFGAIDSAKQQAIENE